MSNVFKRFPDIGRGFFDFIWNPRQYTVKWKTQDGQKIPSKEVVAWCLAASFLLFSTYNLWFGHLTDDLEKAVGVRPPVSPTVVTSATSRPTIERIGWYPGFGLGLNFPHVISIPTSRPQIAVFTFGAAQIVMGNVIPDTVVKKPILTLFLSLYALCTVLCLHFPVRLLRGTGKYAGALRLALNFYAYIWLAGSFLIVVSATLLIHIVRLKGGGIFVGWSILVLLPIAIASVRGFFAAFSEYYALSKKRLFLAAVGSVLLSSLFGPLFFAPGVYVLLWASPFLEIAL